MKIVKKLNMHITSKSPYSQGSRHLISLQGTLLNKYDNWEKGRCHNEPTEILPKKRSLILLKRRKLKFVFSFASDWLRGHASFADQLQSKIKHNQYNCRLIFTINEN